VTSLVWSPLKYAALNDCQIRISSGGETKKIKVLDSEPNPSLAKSPNAHYTAVYAEIIRDYELSTRHYKEGVRSQESESAENLTLEIWCLRFGISSDN
jgi:hypothetical protein